jgi:predicted MFS family arabinose efflux permease
MQQLSDQDVQPANAGIGPRRAMARRKVTVRLNEGVCGQLDVATERPGIGKSMFVEAALEHFMNPVPSVEAVVHDKFERMHARFDRLEHDVRMLAETVALYARYQMFATPPVPQERQHDAILLGDERFRVLAEQVDHRVRSQRPLMQEMIDHLNSRDGERIEKATRDQPACDWELQQNKPRAVSEEIEIAQVSRPDASQADGDPATPAKRHERPRPAYKNRRPISAETGSLAQEAEFSKRRSLSNWRLIFSVFLPFAAGYFLSFLFRTINASISPALASDFGLGAVQTGLLASLYFLVFAGAQIPIGVLLDRYGPRRVQSILLIFAVGGASLFANADSFTELLIGRAMIGLGVAAALMAGLKAIVTWFPKDRIAFVNGAMIMLGSLGAITATTPTDWLLDLIGWRSLFGILALMTFVTAAVIYFVVPTAGEVAKTAAIASKPFTLGSVFSDPRFMRMAPLSATCIGSSWAMQSLWAASWLTDVDGLDHHAVVNLLFLMAMGIGIGALLLGTMADRLRKRGVTTEALLAGLEGLFIIAELALVLRVPLPSILPWSAVSIVGAGTVLSFTLVARYFPVEMAARANGALNLVHFGWAFVVQYGIGLILGHWSTQTGHYPVVATRLRLAFASCCRLWP